MTDFDTWWAAYPKKVAKRLARKKFNDLTKEMPPLDQMLAILEMQKRSKAWLKNDGEFIPHPTTYLNQGRWEDELEVTLPKDIVNEKPWHETWPGIVAKGRELGLLESQFTYPQDFKAAVIKAAKETLRAA